MRKQKTNTYSKNSLNERIRFIDKVIDLYREGLTYIEIAKVLSTDISTISKIITLYNLEGENKND